jgi:hypothetical protein
MKAQRFASARTPRVFVVHENDAWVEPLRRVVLAWLKQHGRIVVNGERALQLEVSKVAQYEALKAFGIATPDTIAVIGRDNIADAAKISFPVILKHNRAGKGLGVRLLFSAAALAEHVDSPDFEESRDGKGGFGMGTDQRRASPMFDQCGRRVIQADGSELVSLVEPQAGESGTAQVRRVCQYRIEN